MLIMQGALDDNVLPAVQEKFAETYKAAGGDCHYQLFEGSEHEWVAKPGPQTDRAREMVKAFIARQLKTTEGRSGGRSLLTPVEQEIRRDYERAARLSS